MNSERKPKSPILTCTYFVGPATVLSVLLVSVVGLEPLKTWLPVNLILSVVFYLTPLVFVYTLALLGFHRRRYSVDFWMLELMLAIFPLAILLAYFCLGLLSLGLDHLP